MEWPVSCCMTQFSSCRDVNGWHQVGVAQLQMREGQTGSTELQRATAKDRDLNFEMWTVSGQLIAKKSLSWFGGFFGVIFSPS